MAETCNINGGLNKAYKTNQGGVHKVYLFPFVKYSRSDVSFDGQTIDSFPLTTVYGYEATNIAISESSKTETRGSSWSTSLSFDIPQTNAAIELFKLLKRDYCAITLDRLGNYRLLGIWNGGETSINAGSGSDKNSMNGSSVKIEFKEDNQAYFISDFGANFTIFDSQIGINNFIFDDCTNYIFEDGTNYIFNN